MAARVLFLSHSADRTGPPMYLLGLQRWLRAHTDLELATAFQRGGELLDEFAALGEVLHLPGDEPVARPLLDASGYDLVYLNASWTVRSLSALADVRALVAHVHEMDDVIRFQLDAQDRAALFDRPDLLLVGARSARENLERHGVASERIADVPYFLPIEPPLGAARRSASEARQVLGLDPSLPLVLGGGVVDWRKAPDLLLHVGWHLERAGVACTVAWVGDRNERPTWCDWDEEAQRLGLARVVHLPATADLAGVLAAADVFVLSSREDTFPLVCLEAAALGVPIVCFDDAGFVELLADTGGGGAGVAVPYPDLEAMAAAVAGLLGDPDLRRATGERASARYEERHRIDVAARRLLALLEPWLGAA